MLFKGPKVSFRSNRGKGEVTISLRSEDRRSQKREGRREGGGKEREGEKGKEEEGKRTRKKQGGRGRKEERRESIAEIILLFSLILLGI